jgi:hypothetical protein
MVQTVALKLEDELNSMGKPELVCHISEELIKIVKQVGIRWNPIYLRRCLDERYKNPVNRLNALARKRYPGVPQDTGKTAEELEASLNRKAPAGEYTVKCNMTIEGNKPVSTLAVEHEDGKIHAFIPVIVRVNAAQQNAVVELDKEKYDAFIARYSESDRVKLKPKSKSKAKSKNKKHIEELATKVLNF